MVKVVAIQDGASPKWIRLVFRLMKLRVVAVRQPPEPMRGSIGATKIVEAFGKAMFWFRTTRSLLVAPICLIFQDFQRHPNGLLVAF